MGYNRHKPAKYAANHVSGRLHSMCAAFVRMQFPDIYEQFKGHVYQELGLERRYRNRDKGVAERAVEAVLACGSPSLGAATSNLERSLAEKNLDSDKQRIG